MAKEDTKKELTAEEQLQQTLEELEKVKKEAENAKKQVSELNKKIEEKATEKVNVVAEVKEPEEEVEIMLPLTKERKDDYFVGINGKSYLIKRGVHVKVPKSVEEVIRHQQKMDEQSLRNMEKASKNFV